MRIDSHHHLWHYSSEDYPWIDSGKLAIRQDYLIPELDVALSGTGVERTVVVQARQKVVETEWLLELAANHSVIAGVVGWLPLSDSAIGDYLQRYAENRNLAGVRHVVHDEPDDGFILRDDFNRGVARLCEFDLTYDILIFAKHLKNTIRFVDQHPHQVFVLDHIAKPAIAKAQFDAAWEQDIRELAKRPNVSCKFSGVVTEVRDPEWDVQLVKPYWDVALESFGSDRLMFGSDWPVCLLRSEYAKWVATVETLASELSESEQESFWSGNAIRAYGLKNA